MIAPVPERVLLIRPSALGDVCRTVPLVASMKAVWPETQIDWLVQEGFEDAVRAHPAVRTVVSFPRQQAKRWWTLHAWQGLAGLVHTLRAAQYDLVIDAQGLARSGALTRLTGSPLRVGPSDGREGSPLAYSMRVDVQGAGAHTVERMLALVAALGVPVRRDMALYPPSEDAEAVTRDPRLSGGPFAVLAPTSRWPGKRWPAARFAELATALLASGSVATLAVVGGSAEREQCGPLLSLAARDSRVVDLIGQTSVGRLMAVISQSTLVVANDSAALHMAVGLSRPYVGLFGPTEVARVGPFGGVGLVLQHRTPNDTLDHKHGERGA
ncbi:MAG: glycosyltransferase family 9 protein, partial [Phycisphaerales bacterium]